MSKMVLLEKWDKSAPDSAQKLGQHLSICEYTVWLGQLQINCVSVTTVGSGPLVVLEKALILWGDIYYLYSEMRVGGTMIVFPRAEVESDRELVN